MSSSSAPPAPLIGSTTIISLLAVLVVLIVAYAISIFVLAPKTRTSIRAIYVWHLFDALIHLIFEAAFLYNCFFVYAAGDSPNGFLAQPLRTYGSAYGSSPMAKLWQEYAKADSRWGGADLTVISLELLTVLIGGPLAAYICERIRLEDPMVWFWMVVLATGELYGGFMTFSPEWLCGSPNLDTSNFLYLYVYLFFFNVLWVVFPLYVMYEAYGQMAYAFSARGPGLTSPSSGSQRRSGVARKKKA